jgi:hypothetical protein
MFCEEKESCSHFFFDHVVATRMWNIISQVAGTDVGGNFENIGATWLCKKRFVLINIISSAALWALWKM